MEPRLILFFAPAVLVLLSGRSATSQSVIVDDPQHSTEGVKLFWKWWSLYQNVARHHTLEVGGPCSATVDQSYALRLLEDLIFDVKPNGTIDYLLRRKPFYTKHFDALKANFTYCDFRGTPSLVCNSNNNTCVKCSSEIDPMLRENCEFEKGGENTEQVELIPGELPEADRLSRPPLGEEEGACGSGWLSAHEAKEWYTTITQKDVYKRMGTFFNCTMNVEAEVAFSRLTNLILNTADATALETEIAEYGDWWEEQLWVFKGRKHLNLAFCKKTDASSSGGAPYVCGMDGFCVSCYSIHDYNMAELIAAFPDKGRLARPEDQKTRVENCADSKLTTTTDGSGGSSSDGYGTQEPTESKGVCVGASLHAIAVFVVFLQLLIVL